MKTKEELNAIKAEVEALNKKLCELTDEELKWVTGGNQNGECYALVWDSSENTFPDISN